MCHGLELFALRMVENKSNSLVIKIDLDNRTTLVVIIFPVFAMTITEKKDG
jgi:hypothetical protein